MGSPLPSMPPPPVELISKVVERDEEEARMKAEGVHRITAFKYAKPVPNDFATKFSFYTGIWNLEIGEAKVGTFNTRLVNDRRQQLH